MRIDAHVHLIPDAVREDPAAMRESDPWFAECFPEGKGMGDAVQLSAMLDDQKLDACILAGWPFRSIDDCHAMTEAAAGAARQDARIAFLGMIHPLDPNLDDALDHALKLGCCGVGEVNADGFGIHDDRLLYRLAEACADRKLPLLVHCSEPVGHAYPGKGTFALHRIEKLLQAVPRCTMVLAHLGGGFPFYAVMPEVRELLSHAYVDTAAAPWLYQPEALTRVADSWGWERIIFGSDFPLMAKKKFTKWLNIQGMAVPEEVWGDTAARIYGILPNQENDG